MSAQNELKGEAFRKWKQDLDERCEEHLLEHPEETGTQQRPTNLKVRVFESIYAPGAWNVYVGDERITTFTGDGAKEKAASFAFNLANKPEGSK